MCARRFLIAIFVLTLLVVGGAFAIFQWGGNVLLHNASPTGHFQRETAGGAPDYEQASSWVARPGSSVELTQWTPVGARLPDPITRVDTQVFYIHPTTYLLRDRWNAPLSAGGDTEGRTRLFVQSQASAFGQLGEVWAPRYRQAAYGAFLLKDSDAQQALDLAYADVAAAFEEFLRRIPSDSPIILAGHSQGALHLERLLRERIAGKPVARRIVAAYVVGWPVSTTSDLPALGLPACAAAGRSRCILSWMSFGEPANPDLIFHEWQKTKGLTGGERRQADVLCVNPITGAQNGAAAPAENPGTLVPTADLSSATLLPARVGARCDQGLLKLDGEIPALGPFVLPGNNYHVYDYALFWAAIRQDAERRIAAWQR
jgi:hypothetical protein